MSITTLMKLEQAERMLAEITTVEDAANLVDFAEAARVYAKQAKLGTSSINSATTIKLKAERRLADLVDEGQANGQIATQARGGANLANGLRTAEAVPLLDVPTKPAPATLDDIGVSYQRLHEARKIRDNYTDDDIVERNGHHLFIENKHAHSGEPLNLSLPTGQRIALESLCRSGHTVLVLHGCGHNNDPVYLQTWKPDGNGGIDRNGTDLQEMDLETRRYCLREFFANWCQWAEGKNERTETQTRMEAPF